MNIKIVEFLIGIFWICGLLYCLFSSDFPGAMKVTWASVLLSFTLPIMIKALD